MQDIESENLAVERPSVNSSKIKRRSVFFNQEDIEQTVPSLPVLSLVEELQSRHGKTLYAEEFIKAVEDADANHDGLISIPELITIIESMQNLKKENTGLKKYLTLAICTLLLVLVAIFGLVFAVVQLTKEVSTGGPTGNALVSSTTGIIVDTHPSDGGGIYLDMAAFTEPVNITFPVFGETRQCVGRVPVDAINQHYDQFTTGGSSLTIRHVDYTKDSQPVVYTHIPAANTEVTGSFGTSNEAALAAQEATAAIKETQGEFGSDPEGRKRHLQEVLAGGEGKQNEKNAEGLSDVGSDTASRTNDGSEKIKQGTFARGTDGKGGRRLQEAQDLQTVEDFMRSFAALESDIEFTKDKQLSDDFYFVCHSTAVV